MMNSLNKIFEILPFDVFPKKEVFSHPKRSTEVNPHGYCGTFQDAVDAKKCLTTYDGGNKHAVTLFDIRSVLFFKTLIFKDSQRNKEKTIKVAYKKGYPEIGRFIDFPILTSKGPVFLK